ncbi:1-phosphatidylinositol-4,5-bisphosphate phosphodiesterase gamma-1, partial [Stegodyphus mimosarum]
MSVINTQTKLSKMAASSVMNGVSSMPTSLSEIEQIYRKLEQGTDLLKLYLKRKPERRTFCVKLETRQIIWLRPVAGRNIIEG